MLPPGIAEKIRLIEIQSKKQVHEVFSGAYKSVFKGRGIEFFEVREYLPGDDVRLIDWNVTARMGRPYVKLFQEERQLTVMLMVDLSGSGRFGSGKISKNELACQVAAVFAFSALRNNDKVGMILFTDRIEKFVPPARGNSHVLSLIRDILLFKPEGRKTDIAGALRWFFRVQKKSAVVIILSDFLDEGYNKNLRLMDQHHDVIAIKIHDPRERDFPSIGLVRLEDAETGEVTLINTSDPGFRKEFARKTDEEEQTWQQAMKSARVDFISLSTDEDYIPKLVSFFKKRTLRMG
ncbi:MAG: DUF58 domain-containing protein [Candidatus Eremiobacteraeota bacterium]|nr:DUF58 domain-containing protein [Candidatus Eremiobacteraeota bacterium]